MTPLPSGLAATRRELSAGATLFRCGDRVTSMYLVEAGQVELSRTLENGSLLPLASYGPGQWVAEASLFSSAYHCDAAALTPVRLQRVSKPALLQALRADPDAMLALLAQQARSLQALRTASELRNLRPLAARMLAWLEVQATDRDGWISPAGHWKATARMLGASHEALYRCLATLEAQGLVERHEGRIRRRRPPAV